MSDALRERFNARVAKGEGCWPWTGTKGPRGYGVLRVGGKAKRATHVAVFLATGSFPAAGLMVCHHCDNPPCVRPDHLFVGTNRDNVLDRHRKGRTKIVTPPPHAKPRGERNGASKLTAEQVREIRVSSEPSRTIAPRFGVEKSTIVKIRARKVWAHVE